MNPNLSHLADPTSAGSNLVTEGTLALDGAGQELSKTTTTQSRRRNTDPYGCLISFAILGSILVIVAGVIMKMTCLKLLNEYNTKFLGRCRVIGSSLLDEITWCECGICRGRHTWTCLSSYPCYRIEVSYVIEGRYTATGTGNITGFNSSTSCSIDLLAPCYTREFMNKKIVEIDLAELEKVSNIGCIYNKNNPGSLRLSRDYTVISEGKVAFCFFWPVMIYVLCLLWLIIAVKDAVKSFRQRHNKRSRHEDVQLSATSSGTLKKKKAISQLIIDSDADWTKKRMHASLTKRDVSLFAADRIKLPISATQRSATGLARVTIEQDAAGPEKRQQLEKMSSSFKGRSKNGKFRCQDKSETSTS